MSICVEENWKNTSGKYECPFCSKEYTKMGISTHIWRTHTDAGEKHLGVKKGNVPWNKGLTAVTSEAVAKQRNTLKDGFDSGRLEGSMKGKKHSDETKDKISKIRIKYLEENPDKVPYKLNHYSKGESYPEKYFRELFEKMDIEFKQEVRIGLYSLDFVIGSLNIEIDGEQHYVDDRIVESDKRRNEFVESQGFDVVRIRWSEYQRMNYEEKEIFINDILMKTGL
jgi:very-short-patch-repair endonuclease